MALRVFETRKTKDTAPRSIVCLADDAVDTDAMGPDGRAKYLETLSDGHLKLRPGGKPTRFSIVPLTRDQLRQCQIEGQREAERSGGFAESVLSTVMAEAAFRRGCTRVHGVELVTDAGDTVLGDLPRERWLEELPPAWVQYVGLAVINLSVVPTPPPDRPEEDLGKS